MVKITTVPYTIYRLVKSDQNRVSQYTYTHTQLLNGPGGPAPEETFTHSLFQASKM